jgi:hypothetical protein
MKYLFNALYIKEAPENGAEPESKRYCCTISSKEKPSLDQMKNKLRTDYHIGQNVGHIQIIDLFKQIKMSE